MCRYSTGKFTLRPVESENEKNREKSVKQKTEKTIRKEDLQFDARECWQAATSVLQIEQLLFHPLQIHFDRREFDVTEETSQQVLDQRVTLGALHFFAVERIPFALQELAT